MTTPSQTEAPAAGGPVVDSSVGKPTQPTPFPACPPWCTNGHRRHAVVEDWNDAGERVVDIEHEGPTFPVLYEAEFHVTGVQNNAGEWSFFVYPPKDSDPVGLDGARYWASAAQAAAEWLEAQA